MSNIEMGNCFNRSGIASLSDMKNSEYSDVFHYLEKEQSLFLEHEESFRSAEYKWPRDPLHCWSRIWEYPYAYHHILKEKSNNQNGDLVVVDLGSGVTFFPFLIAKLDFHVLCLDVDPVCDQDLLRAAREVSHKPGRVEFKLIENQTFPLDNDSVDIVCCISVLEHIPDFENSIQEVARILKNGGKFILTIDLDLSGHLDISALRYRDMRLCLSCYFDITETEISPHPEDMLVQFEHISVSELIWFRAKQYLKKMLGKKSHSKHPNLAIWCAVMTKMYVKE